MGELQALQVNYRMFVDVRNENRGKIVAKQNDTKTRYLDITITDNGIPIDLTDCEVRIYGRKYDKTEIYNDGSLQDATEGRCLFEATTQLLAYPGQNVNCEIVVFKDNVQILSTMPFDVFVVESLMGASAIESSNEYGALVVLFQDLYKAYDLMTTMVENIGEPDEVAAQYDLATMWQAWEFLVAYMKGDLTDKINEALANASVQGVLDLIGTTADTGGNSTAGTVMAKLNAGLNTISNRADVNARTKKLTGYYIGRFSKTDITITGQGEIIFYSSYNEQDFYLSIDGGETIEFTMYQGITSFTFEQSVVFHSEYTYGQYIVRT